VPLNETLTLGLLACCLVAAACKNSTADDSPAGGDADADADADADGDSDSDADGDSDSDADDDADTDADGDTDSDTDTGTSCDTDTACGADCEDCTATGQICNEAWGICVVPDCTREDDFTPCEATTDPDRSYDICIGGVCQSPGCGDASCNPPGPHFALPDTSQRECYNNAATMACASVPCDADGGPAFCGQDAQYGWDATHDADERYSRDMTVSGEPVVVDNVTGLEWQGCTYGLTGDDCTAGSMANADWSTQLANCDELSWGGHDDWRLPDRYELQSIASYGSPADSAAFPATPGGAFWSSSSYMDHTVYAWYVKFDTDSGFIDAYDKSIGDYARCVRGMPTPRTSRFTRDTSTAGEPTVLDHATSLEWQGSADGLAGDWFEATSATAMPWRNALAYCEGLSWAGQTDWRLPSVVELTSIVDDHSFFPAIDTTAFPGAPSQDFWSSSSVATDASYAWYIHFMNGYVYHYYDKSSDSYSYHDVRCVRGGT
jgi:hypothetical protein